MSDDTNQEARFTKYAAMTTNWQFGNERDVPIGQNARCGWWNVHAVGEAGARDAWREAFGNLEWEHLRSNRASMFVFGDDVTDATNAINQELEHRVQLARYAYLLHRPHILSGGAFWVFSGLADKNREPLSLRSWCKYANLCNPYFIERPDFAKKNQDYQTNKWVDGWAADFAVFDGARGGPWLISPPFEMAVLSFWDASINSAVDFRIPALVRTIESIIAPPRREAKKRFVERAARFAQDVQVHPYFVAKQQTIEQVLTELYELRSDAVHGKWPLRAMQDAGREDDVALLDFTAEMVARTATRWALCNRTTFATYRTRDALEDAWRNHTVPPP
jgi:hypothetical protein